MKLNVHEIEEAPKRLVYEQPLADLGERLVHGTVCDFEFPGSARIKLDYYRSGEELFFHGRLDVPVVGHCARCLESYPFDIHTDFHVVLLPKPEVPDKDALDADEVGIGYYSGEEIDVGPMIDEPVILALPTRPLCGESCKGLCPNCGINRNQESCDCHEEARHTPLAALHNLKVGR